MKRIIPLLFAAALLLAGCLEAPLAPDTETEPSLLNASDLAAGNNASVSHTTVEVFQPAGPPLGEGLLDEGSVWPPTNGSKATLLRGGDFIQVMLHTTGLPPGAYTAWWALVNNPDGCKTPGACTVEDVFNQDAEPSGFWSTGGVVQANGIGNFTDRTRVGESFGDPGTQHLLGPGLTNPAEVVVFYILKYHGPTSDDPDVLYEQTHTLLGSCDASANALPNGQCFDPQIAFFDAP